MFTSSIRVGRSRQHPGDLTDTICGAKQRRASNGVITVHALGDHVLRDQHVVIGQRRDLGEVGDHHHLVGSRQLG